MRSAIYSTCHFPAFKCILKVLSDQLTHKQVSLMFLFTQSRYRFTLVYTPGYPGRPQPTPHDTMPAKFSQGLEQCGKTIEMPWGVMKEK